MVAALPATELRAPDGGRQKGKESEFESSELFYHLRGVGDPCCGSWLSANGGGRFGAVF